MSPAPLRVADPYLYWTDKPPTLSARCVWWEARIRDHGWRPNRRIYRMGYDPSAHYFGVYIWEWLHVLSPLLFART